MRLSIYSLLVAALVLATADAHAQQREPHVRAALSNKLHRRQVLSGLGLDGLGDVVNDILGNPQPQSSSTTLSASTSSTSSVSSTSSSTTTTSTSTSSSITSASTTTSDSTTSSDSDSNTSTTTSTSSESEITPAPTTSSKGDLGDIIGTVLTGINNATSALVSVLDPKPSDTTSVLPATSTTPIDGSTTEPTSVPTSTTESESASGTETTTNATPTTTKDPTLSDVLTSLFPDTTTTSSTPSTSQSASTPTSEITSAPAEPTTSSKQPILSSILSDLSSIFIPPSPSSSSVPSSLPPTDPITSVPTTTAGPITSGGSSVLPSSIPISIPTSAPITSVPTTSQPISGGVNSTSVVISFPSSVISSPTTTLASSTDDGITSAPTPSTTVSINSDLSFVLTESSLAITSVPTTAPAASLTDPDAVPTTASQEPTPVTTLSAAPLPSDLPGRIYPKVQLDLSQNMSGYSMISILFTPELNWQFVAQSKVSSSQIFAWVPVIIATALDIPADKVKTWALQVYVPASYHSAADAVQLGTTWLGYIPTEDIDALASMIKAKQSLFYTGVQDSVAHDLANHVNPGFSINAVADPNDSNSDSSTGGSKNNSTSSNSSKSRQDAIIGVVSALGAIALLVLGFLGYRTMKRRRELAHRRLSDPVPTDAFVGARPDGREFDQDSVGGQRRRSFYYAEDSLRGFQGQGQNAGDDGHYAYSSQQGMVQRRNVVPNAISAPILQESSMNW